MNPHWLEMRIQEEQERRRKEAKIQELLPQALEELYQQLSECVERYKEAFGPESAAIVNGLSKIRVTARDERDGKWQVSGTMEIGLVPKPPGFQVERGDGEPVLIELGLLPGDRFSYRVGEQFLTNEDLSRYILDRLLFPKLTQ